MNVNSVAHVFVKQETDGYKKRAHAEDKPFKCKQCGECFSIARNLGLQERVHAQGKNLLNVNSLASVLDNQETYGT